MLANTDYWAISNKNKPIAVVHITHWSYNYRMGYITHWPVHIAQRMRNINKFIKFCKFQ